MTQSTWFISDLHLDASRPQTTHAFLQLLGQLQGKASTLYILGDLFEYWIGDDILDTPQGQVLEPITRALRTLSDSGTRLYFIHGNRDFLLGDNFAERTGIQLLAEHQLIEMNGERVLIMHGDTLCTDDLLYQQARLQLRSPDWQRQVLALSIPERIEKAKAMRLESEATMSMQAEDILDVNEQTVQEVMREYGVSYLIHGHTHRPAIHRFEINGAPARRIVLGDWYEQASYLCLEDGNLALTSKGEQQLIRFP